MRSFRSTIIISIVYSQISILSTVLYIFLTPPSIFANVFSSYGKQLCFQRSIDCIEIRGVTTSSYFFAKRFCFRKPGSLQQLLLSNKYFLVTNSFSDQLLLIDKYIFSTTTALDELLLQNKQLFRACTFSKQVLVPNSYFSDMNFFTSMYFLKTVSLVPHKQLRSIDTGNPFL